MWWCATSTTRCTWRPAPSTSVSVVLFTWRTRATMRSRILRSRSRVVFAAAGMGSRGQALDRSDEELGLERFDDPALGARLLGALDQRGLAFGRQHHDRQRLPARVGAQLLEHLEPVHARHVDIADQHRDRRIDPADL